MLYKVEVTADRINPPELKRMYLTVLMLLEMRGFDLQPQVSGVIAGNFRGVKILNLAPHSKYFRADVKRKHGWQHGIQIRRANDWILFVNSHLQPALDETDFSAKHYPVGDPKVNLANLSHPGIAASLLRRQGIDLNEERYAEEHLRRLTLDQIERRPKHIVDRRDGWERFHSSPLRDDYGDWEDE